MDCQRFEEIFESSLARGGGITALTGAGISAESGVPTFRGPEGYWTADSRVYQPRAVRQWCRYQRVTKVYQRDGATIDVNIETNRFGPPAERCKGGMVIRKPSSTTRPWIVNRMKNMRSNISQARIRL